MTPAGLPGFLRRSIRTLDDVDSADEDDGDGVNGNDVGDLSNGLEGLSMSVAGPGVPLPPPSISVPSPNANAAGQKKMPRVGVSEIYQQQQSMANATRKSGSNANINVNVNADADGRNNKSDGNSGNSRWNETPPSSVNAKFRMVATPTHTKRGSGLELSSDIDRNGDGNGSTRTNGNAGEKIKQRPNQTDGDKKGQGPTSMVANEENANQNRDNSNGYPDLPNPSSSSVTTTTSTTSSTDEKNGTIHGTNHDNGVTTTPMKKPTEKSQQPQPPTTAQRTKNYKEIEFDKVISAPVVNITDLRRLAWNGIPPHHRPQAWKMLLGYLPTNTARRAQTLKRKRSEYKDAILQHYDIDDHSRTIQEQETLRQVLVDVPRTAPDVPLFRNDKIRQSLSRLLYIWAMRHPASSYVQGINDLATPLVAVFLSEYFHDDSSTRTGSGSGNGNGSIESSSSSSSSARTTDAHAGENMNTTTSILDAEQLDLELTQEILDNVEADVYWCLTNLLAGIQDHYTSDQPGVQRMVMRLEELVTRMDVGLTQHLESTGVMFMQFAFRWMNCLLLREFNLKCIIRLWVSGIGIIMVMCILFFNESYLIHFRLIS